MTTVNTIDAVPLPPPPPKSEEQILAEFLALHASKRRKPKPKPPRRSKFLGVKTETILVRFTADQLAEIDRVAALARFLQNDKPCPRVVAIRWLIEQTLIQIRPEVEEAAADERRRIGP